MSNELAPFHAGHKLVGALLWATSKFFDHARWENAPLPGIDHRHRPLPQFMRMADDHLWVLIHAMRDGQPDKVRISRGTGRLWHYWRTAACCIAPTMHHEMGMPGRVTDEAFARTTNEFDGWGGRARCLHILELACGRFSRAPDIGDLLANLGACEPGSDAWDVELADAVAKVLSMDGIESHEQLMARESGQGRFTPLRNQYVDHLSIAVNKRVDELLGSYLKVVDIDTGEKLKEALA